MTPSLADRAVTELKVIAATAASAAVGVGIAVLNAVSDNPGLLGETPAVVEFAILALVPPLVTFLSGYAAPHSERPDLHPVRAATPNPLSPRN